MSSSDIRWAVLAIVCALLANATGDASIARGLGVIALLAVGVLMAGGRALPRIRSGPQRGPRRR